MLKTLLVIAVGFLPPLLSLWMMRKNRLRLHSQMRQASINFQPPHRVEDSRFGESNRADRYYLEGVGYLIGDISCQFNARSGYMRCAVNPSGPCQGCRHYQPKEMVASEKDFK